MNSNFANPFDFNCFTNFANISTLSLMFFFGTITYKKMIYAKQSDQHSEQNSSWNIYN